MADKVERAPGAWRWERHAPLTGIAAVVLWVAGILVAGDKTNKDTGKEILAAVRDNNDRILVGGLLWLIGTALFVWFLGTLRSRLLAAEGGPGRLAATAFGGGIATAACAALIPGPDMAAALSDDDIDASAASAMHNLTAAFFVAAEYLAPVLLVASALAALRYGALPRWLAWVSLLIALVLLIGPIGWAALIFAVPLWVIVVSFLLYRWWDTAPAAAPGYAASP
jgi:hypothetical protein